MNNKAIEFLMGYGFKLMTNTKGENQPYHTVHIGNGYVWIQYNRDNGGQGFIPIREYKNGKFDKLWGTIK